MDAWEILSGNSTEPLTEDTWTHLNNQQGGGGFEQLFMTPVDRLTFSIIEEPMCFAFNNLELLVDFPVVIGEAPEGNLELKMEII